MKYLQPVIIAFMLFLLTTAGHTRETSQLEWNTFDGDFLSLSDYRGKVVIVIYWATYCPPCHRTMQHLQSVYPKYKHQGLEIIAISLDSDEHLVIEHMKKHNLYFPVTLKAYTSANNEMKNVIGTPTNFLIDRDGKIIKKQYGAISYEMIEQEWVRPFI